MPPSLSAYYNENDPYAARWLGRLIDAGLLPPGDVDERSIVDVRPQDVDGYGQCHFFAGIGGWPLALSMAGWPTNRPVWTGSCPCQPFSAAGKRQGFDDPRHLWPVWQRLIQECRPAIVFGEQVEAGIRQGWLDAVFADLEAEGYACGATVLPACGVGAPHIRQRAWFVADAASGRHQGNRDTRRWRNGFTDSRDDCRGGCGDVAAGATIGEQGNTQRLARDTTSELADADGRDASTERLQRGGEQRQQPQDGGPVLGPDGLPDIDDNADGLMADTMPTGRPERRASTGNGSSAGGGWSCDWLPCTDGKARPVEPGTFPLAHGIPGRVGRLRAYGNAIVPQVAAQFITAYLETRP